jgi:hypothetical protein
MFAALLLGSILSDESMLKVSIITDINKAWKLLKGRDITTKEFDHLYDTDPDTLQKVHLDLQCQIRDKVLPW